VASLAARGGETVGAAQGRDKARQGGRGVRILGNEDVPGTADTGGGARRRSRSYKAGKRRVGAQIGQGGRGEVVAARN
jgi:hypothetical protein